MMKKMRYTIIFKGDNNTYPFRTRKKVLRGEQIHLNLKTLKIHARVVGTGWENNSFVVHVQN